MDKMNSNPTRRAPDGALAKVSGLNEMLGMERSNMELEELIAKRDELNREIERKMGVKEADIRRIVREEIAAIEAAYSRQKEESRWR